MVVPSTIAGLPVDVHVGWSQRGTLKTEVAEEARLIPSPPGLAVVASLHTVAEDGRGMCFAIPVSSFGGGGSWGCYSAQLAPGDSLLIGTGSRGAGGLVSRVTPRFSLSGRQ